MIQKILKVGSSAAVTIPKKSLDELGLEPGDQVLVEIDKNRRAVIIEPAVTVESEILTWTKKFIEKYRTALEALAKK
jgi:putative addiction module antidote